MKHYDLLLLRNGVCLFSSWCVKSYKMIAANHHSSDTSQQCTLDLRVYEDDMNLAGVCLL